MKIQHRFRTKEAVAGLAFLGVSIGYLALALPLKRGAVGNPGPGFVPLLIGVSLALCSVVFLARHTGARETSRLPDPDPARHGRASVWGIAGCTLAYPFALDSVGFFLSTAAAAMTMLLLLQPRRVAWALATAVVTALVCFLVFPIALGVSFPFGVADEFLYHIVRG
jgi:hypothetical protein